MISKGINEREIILKAIKDDVVTLKTSPLYTYRIANKYFPVIGEGSHTAKIMFIGEAPGKNEAKTGRPFCGAAGKILDELLRYVNLQRSDVYMTNIVKDRPHDNRDPEPQEIELYGPFLERQIDAIQPKILATLGRFSMKYVIEKYGDFLDLKPISENHGKVLEGQASYGNIKIVPFYHPAAAIYNQHLKETLLRDFEILKDLI